MKVFALGLFAKPLTDEQRKRMLPKELLQQVATRATAKGETIHNEPFEVHADMVADAIRAADASGRAWKKHNGEARSK